MIRILFLSTIIISSASHSICQERPKDWFNESFNVDKSRGVSINSFYEKIDQGKLEEVVVAIIDNGVDIFHQDFEGQIWINEDEIVDNGIDDDNNGYVDDIHGWNFLGNPDGQNINQENLEITRLYRDYSNLFKDVNLDTLSEEWIEKFVEFKQVQKEFEIETGEVKRQFEEYAQLTALYSGATSYFKQKLGKSDLTINDIIEYEPADDDELEVKGFLLMAESQGLTKYIKEGEDYFDSALNYHYNLEFKPRSIVNEELYTSQGLMYGNNHVWAHTPDHGTHVTGIIAAKRNNDIGIDGIAVNARIMALRAVPDGDERDEDIAHAIRYAADNGADVINMSFGKKYSPKSDIVDEAIDYAISKDVLLVHAAGNESTNNDEVKYYPDGSTRGKKSKPGLLVVGACTYSGSSVYVANFSNYGKKKVDILAPGYDIYSTISENKYDWKSGTSMAAPVVSGIAAVLRGLHPDLSADEIKKMIIKSIENYKGIYTSYNDQKIKLKDLVRYPGFIDLTSILD